MHKGGALILRFSLFVGGGGGYSETRFADSFNYP